MNSGFSLPICMILRETNATLEAIAQALFKSWFVDLDPGRAKQQGIAPAGMDEATAALFPDSFEESTLGPVPKGWRQGKVSDFAQMRRESVNPGGSGDTVFEHHSLPVFDAGQFPGVCARCGRVKGVRVLRVCRRAISGEAAPVGHGYFQ